MSCILNINKYFIVLFFIQISMSTLPVEYKKAFKDADIRGVYPTQIDEVVTYRDCTCFRGIVLTLRR